MSEIKIAWEGGLAQVTINRPRQRNAMTRAMWREVAHAFTELGSDPVVRGILLTGAGDDFCAGADISAFAAVRAGPAQSAEYEEAVDRCSEAIAAAPKPTIAVIRGYCLGGGCHLAMACDFRFAVPGATFAIPAARLSIVYGRARRRSLVSLVGLANAKRMLFSAERFDATE